MILAAICLVIGLVLGYARGISVERRRAADIRLNDVEAAFRRGKSVGGDELANAFLDAAAAAGDPLDAWPRSRGGRPS